MKYYYFDSACCYHASSKASVEAVKADYYTTLSLLCMNAKHYGNTQKNNSTM